MPKMQKLSFENDPPLANAMETASIVGSVGASIASMWLNVRETFHKKVRKDVFKHQSDKRTNEIAELGDKLALGEVTTDQFKEQLGTIRSDYRKTWDANIEKMGIHSWTDKFNYLNKFEKTKMAIVGATVLTVGIGATLTLRSQHHKSDTTPPVDNLKNQMSDAPSR